MSPVGTTSPGNSHVQAMLRVPSRRDTLFAVGMVLVVVWAVVDPALWPLALAGAVIVGVGLGQMVGWIRPI